MSGTNQLSIPGWTTNDPDDDLTFRSISVSHGSVQLTFENRQRFTPAWVYTFDGLESLEGIYDVEVVEDWPGEVCELMRSSPYRVGDKHVTQYWVVAGKLSMTIVASRISLAKAG